MDVFQGLPSNSVPLCLTSWENQIKSAKTSEKNGGPRQVWFILGSKKPDLRFATANGDKDHTFSRNTLWSDETKIELFGHNDHRYV